VLCIVDRLSDILELLLSLNFSTSSSSRIWFSLLSLHLIKQNIAQQKITTRAIVTRIITQIISAPFRQLESETEHSFEDLSQHYIKHSSFDEHDSPGQKDPSTPG